MKLPAVVAILVLAIAMGGASARGPVASGASAAADRYVSGELKAQRIPGLAPAGVRDGHVMKARGYGLANVELNVPVVPETVFQTGSVGKQFTATAVMMLVEEGKIGLDDHMSKYFPDAPPAWKSITIRNLLTHTSGIPDDTEKIIDLRQ